MQELTVVRNDPILLREASTLLKADDLPGAARMCVDVGAHDLAARVWKIQAHCVAKGSLVRDAIAAVASPRGAVTDVPVRDPAVKASVPKDDAGKSALTSAFSDVLRDRQAKIAAGNVIPIIGSRPEVNTALSTTCLSRSRRRR
jgi:hypothetical protein